MVKVKKLWICAFFVLQATTAFAGIYENGYLKFSYPDTWKIQSLANSVQVVDGVTADAVIVTTLNYKITTKDKNGNEIVLTNQDEKVNDKYAIDIDSQLFVLVYSNKGESLNERIDYVESTSEAFGGMLIEKSKFKINKIEGVKIITDFFDRRSVALYLIKGDLTYSITYMALKNKFKVDLKKLISSIVIK
jgi:hypothetical protein